MSHPNLYYYRPGAVQDVPYVDLRRQFVRDAQMLACDTLASELAEVV
jgi:hypothetical protein